MNLSPEFFFYMPWVIILYLQNTLASTFKIFKIFHEVFKNKNFSQLQVFFLSPLFEEAQFDAVSVRQSTITDLRLSQTYGEGEKADWHLIHETKKNKKFNFVFDGSFGHLDNLRFEIEIKVFDSRFTERLLKKSRQVKNMSISMSVLVYLFSQA